MSLSALCSECRPGGSWSRPTWHKPMCQTLAGFWAKAVSPGATRHKAAASQTRHCCRVGLAFIVSLLEGLSSWVHCSDGRAPDFAPPQAKGPSLAMPPLIPELALASGARMPALGIGTWRMGERARDRTREIASIRLALDLGVSLIDTAEMYG